MTRSAPAYDLQSLTLHQAIDAYEELEREGWHTIRALCLEDRFFLLTRICNRIDMIHPWIYERCREVEAACDGFIDIWGREHYKSSIVTFGGVIQEILLDPEITVGIFSHTKPIAKSFLQQIKREFESNESLRNLFPDVLYANPQKDSSSWSLDGGIIVQRSANPKESTIEAHGLVDGQPTSKHFKLMVFDDVVTKESVNTPDQIVKTTEAWELSDNLGMQGGRKWHVGTRYHYADTYSEIIKRGAATLRHRPATDNGDINGKPYLFTQEEWERKVRDQGEATIAAQMLGNPLAGHQRMFNVNDLQQYEIRPLTLMAYILIDPARSVKRESANTAMVVLGLDAAGNKYLLDGLDHKMDLMERWERMRDLYVRWKRAPGVQGVRVGYEKFGAISDLDYFHERQRIERLSFEIVELEWPREGQGSKEDRVQRLGPDIRNHRLYLPYPTDAKRLTSVQRKMKEDGYDYRIAQPIKRVDQDGNLYDLSENLRLQVSYFPFGGLKDVIDATSRIYDIDPSPPVYIDQNELEPDVV